MRRKFKINRSLRNTGLVLLGIFAVWTALTFWVEYSGIEKVVFEGKDDASKKALIVYNPDPIYKLDEQVCISFAKGLSAHDFRVKIATVEGAKKDTVPYDLYVFCANTYNWAPDWLIKNYIQGHSDLSQQNVVAITLGSGSTSRPKRILEEAINSKGANLLDSRTYWLLRPNDEERMEEKNVEVAKDLAFKFGHEIGEK